MPTLCSTRRRGLRRVQAPRSKRRAMARANQADKPRSRSTYFGRTSRCVGGDNGTDWAMVALLAHTSWTVDHIDAAVAAEAVPAPQREHTAVASTAQARAMVTVACATTTSNAASPLRSTVGRRAVHTKAHVSDGSRCWRSCCKSTTLSRSEGAAQGKRVGRKRGRLKSRALGMGARFRARAGLVVVARRGFGRGSRADVSVSASADVVAAVGSGRTWLLARARRLALSLRRALVREATLLVGVGLWRGRRRDCRRSRLFLVGCTIASRETPGLRVADD